MLAQVAAPASAVRALEEMFAYWAGLRRGGRLPARADIDPNRFKRHLPTISLIDVRPNPTRFRVRLAGTGLYGLYGRETTGLELEQVYRSAEDAAYWQGELEKVVADRRPNFGLRSLDAKEAGGLKVLWLRLPLAGDGENVDMLLGYDALVGDLKMPASGIRAA
ncbi:MAG: PAS domain-containing protein [Caulobacteraceae bacterium]|nr:PAS domain-containing protein [Caulobacteraceae bacterium]